MTRLYFLTLLKMKKILIASLFAALLFPCCGDDDDKEEPAKENNTENTTPANETNQNGNETKPNEVEPSLDDSENKNNEENTKPTTPVSDETDIEVNEELQKVIQGKEEYAKLNVFLCFGQSNMEGNASVGSKDKTNVPDNFKNMIVAKGDADHYNQERYTWRKANPPLARFSTGLTPADYFARTLCQYLPEGGEIGIVMVAIGGTSIEAFYKESCEEFCNKSDHADWLKGFYAQYDNNPYQTLIDAAKEAQKTGVIRGILLHQGETNNGDPNWPDNVKGIYDNIIADLGLDPAQCPLLVGETLRQDQKGGCYQHNAVVAKVPSVIPNSYVISSEGCPGNGQDPWHFSARGYRMLGKRYAEKILELWSANVE